MDVSDRTFSDIVGLLKLWIPGRSEPANMSRDFWMPDQSCRVCYECDSQFTLFNRRHHCRLCGRVFCARCTSNWIPTMSSDSKTLQEDWDKIRVCNFCFKQWDHKSTGTVDSGIHVATLDLSITSPSETSFISSRSSGTCDSSNITFASLPQSTGLSPHQSAAIMEKTTQRQSVAAARNNENAVDTTEHNQSPDQFEFCTTSFLPLLSVASSKHKSPVHFRTKPVIGNERRLALSFSWKSFVAGKVKKFNSEGVGVWRGGLMIKAVATLESTCVTQKSEEVKEYQTTWGIDIDSTSSYSSINEPQSSSEDPTEVDEREKLRRMRISKANKGNTPWNKGKKHSPETRQRIRERTRLAMQDSKVKMKLASLGHAQSEETRMRIGVGVRLGWEKRREKLMLQETCYDEWQNLIADTARRGVLGEEQLQWDSYKILNEQLELEWLQSIEQRTRIPRPKGSKRAPKSADQRRKISEAIAAKWADPAYRNRVCSGLAKFHGIPDGVKRKPRRKPSEGGQTRKRSPPKKKDNLSKPETKSEIQRIRLKRKNTPLYKDPLASSKLEVLKNIRAQRAAAENKKIEVFARAKLLIAEAEKAAAALEIAAKNSPLAQASLVETRMLIAEAIQSIESIKQVDLVSDQYDSNLQASSKLVPHVEEDTSTEIGSPSHVDPRKVNGDQSSWSSETEAEDIGIDVLPDF